MNCRKNKIANLSIPVEVTMRLHKSDQLLREAYDYIIHEHQARMKALKDWENSKIAELSAAEWDSPDEEHSPKSPYQIYFVHDQSDIRKPYYCSHAFAENVIVLQGAKELRNGSLRHILASLCRSEIPNKLRLAVVDPDGMGISIGSLTGFLPIMKDDSYLLQLETYYPRGRSNADHASDGAQVRLPTEFFGVHATHLQTVSAGGNKAVSALVLACDGESTCQILTDRRLRALIEAGAVQVIVNCTDPASVVQKVFQFGFCPVLLNMQNNNKTVFQIGRSALEVDGLMPNLMTTEQFSAAIKTSVAPARLKQVEYRLESVDLELARLGQPERLVSLQTVIGHDIDGDPVLFKLDEMRAHCLVLGTNGSGKTSFVKSVLTGLSHLYTSAELDIRVLDFGAVGYQELDSWNHVSQLLCKRNPEVLLAALGTVNDEFSRRADIFQKASVDSLSKLNVDGIKLPRIVYVLDELQQIYIETSRELQSFAGDILESTLKQGRKYGIHFIIATQTLSNFPIAFRKSITTQVGFRYALVSNDDDFLYLMDNFSATKANRPRRLPECIRVDISGSEIVPFSFRRCSEKIVSSRANEIIRPKVRIDQSSWNFKDALTDHFPTNATALCLNPISPYVLDASHFGDDTLIIANGSECLVKLFRFFECLVKGKKVLAFSDTGRDCSLAPSWMQIINETPSVTTDDVEWLVFWDHLVPKLPEFLEQSDKYKSQLLKVPALESAKRLYIVCTTQRLSRVVKGFKNRFLFADSPQSSSSERDMLDFKTPFLAGNGLALAMMNNKLSTILLHD